MNTTQEPVAGSASIGVVGRIIDMSPSKIGWGHNVLWATDGHDIETVVLVTSPAPQVGDTFIYYAESAEVVEVKPLRNPTDLYEIRVRPAPKPQRSAGRRVAGSDASRCWTGGAMNLSPIPKTGNRNPVKVAVKRMQKARAALAKAGQALRHLGYNEHANETIGAVRLLSGWIDGVLDDARTQPSDMTCPVCEKPITESDVMESTGYINYHKKCCDGFPSNTVMDGSDPPNNVGAANV